MAAPQSVVQRSFASGEIAPAFASRADLVEYTTGLRTCRNAIVQRQGGFTNRPGFRYTGRVKGGVALRAAIIARSPTNYWRLNEAAGAVAYDLGSGAANGTIAGGPVQGTMFRRTGTRGTTFDGVNDFITVAGSATGTTFWLAFWIKPNSAAASASVIIGQSGNTELRYNPSTRIISLEQSGSRPMNTALTDGVEYFIIVNVVAGVGAFYLDGVQDGTFTGVASWTPDRIGGISAVTQQFKGTLSDIAVKAGVSLTAGQITALYAARNDSQQQLLRYVSAEPGESLLIEAGAGYLRFYRAGAQVNIAAATAWSNATPYIAGDLVSLAGINYYCMLAHTNHTPPNPTYWYPLEGTIYEVPTPFTSGFNWVQNGTVITMTHRDVAPQELYFLALTRFVIQPVAVQSAAPTVTNVVVVPDGVLLPGYTADQWQYAVSAAAPSTYEEGLPGFSARFASQTPAFNAPHTISWDAMTVGGVACPEYYVYVDKYLTGTLQYVATVTGRTSFINTGIEPEPRITPQINQVLFASSGNYPHRAAYHQQRRLFAASTNEADVVQGSKTGFPSNFCRSSPLQDDDAITFRVAANQHHPIRHMVSLKDLLILTAAAEWTVRGGDGPKSPITPSSIDAEPELYVGSSEATPIVSGNSLIYVQARGRTPHDVRFDQEVQGLGGRDLSLFAGHLFDAYTLEELDYQLVPHSVVWFVRSDGTLLGMTYIREQNVIGWHRHDTGADGEFEHVCVVPEDDEDVVYVIVKRTIAGVDVRYIERLERREIFTYNEDVFFVDSGLSYQGSAVSAVSGLDHLEGATVVALGDGVPLGEFTVASGAIANLGALCSDIHVGLPITCDLETLDLDINGSGIRDKPKSVKSVSLLLDASARTFEAGPTSAKLVPFRKAPAPQDQTLATAAFTGQVELSVQSQFTREGRVFIRHTDPLPLTILGIIPSVEIGG